MVVNTDDPALLGEIAHLMMLVADAKPEITPVMNGEQAMQILPGVIERAVKSASALGL
jgi:hypothetical protein